MQIGFAGMTHLGLVSAVAAAERGAKVVCFDDVGEHFKALKAGNTQINEPQLNELLNKNLDSLEFTTKAPNLRSCDIVYISADVPTNSVGESDLEPISKLIEIVLTCIQPSTTLVVLCQVPPGFTRRIHQRHEKTFYQVETLILVERSSVRCFQNATSLAPLTLATSLQN